MAKKVPLDSKNSSGETTDTTETARRRKRRPNPDTPENVRDTLDVFAKASKSYVLVKEEVQNRTVSTDTLREIFLADKTIRLAKAAMAYRRNSEYKRQMIKMLDDWADELSAIADKIADGNVAVHDPSSLAISD